MKLCKKIQILKRFDELQFFIPKDEDDRGDPFYYTNNIGPARIVFNNEGKITRFVYLKNNRYTNIPSVFFQPERIKALFFSRTESWFDAYNIYTGYFYTDRLYHKTDKSLLSLIEGIEKTNLFIEFLNKNHLLERKLKPIEWVPQWRT